MCGKESRELHRSHPKNFQNEGSPPPPTISCWPFTTSEWGLLLSLGWRGEGGVWGRSPQRLGMWVGRICAQEVKGLNQRVYVSVVCHGRSLPDPKILTKQMATSQRGVTAMGLPQQMNPLGKAAGPTASLLHRAG